MFHPTPYIDPKFSRTDTVVQKNAMIASSFGSSGVNIQREHADCCANETMTAEAPPPKKAIGLQKHQCGLAPWQLSKAREFISDNLTRTVLIKSLAQTVRLSESYFYSAFRRSFGEPPHAYITRLRIERAKELMIATKLPLAQIALECGLADQPHLTRLFRNQVGCSPASWRRSVNVKNLNLPSDRGV
jgi:AraC-like DNA-binding protein